MLLPGTISTPGPGLLGECFAGSWGYLASVGAGFLKFTVLSQLRDTGSAVASLSRLGSPGGGQALTRVQEPPDGCQVTQVHTGQDFPKQGMNQQMLDCFLQLVARDDCWLIRKVILRAAQAHAYGPTAHLSASATRTHFPE